MGKLGSLINDLLIGNWIFDGKYWEIRVLWMWHFSKEIGGLSDGTCF